MTFSGNLYKKNKKYELGVCKNGNEYDFAIVSKEKSLRVHFRTPDTEDEFVLELNEDFKVGDVFCYTIKDFNLDGYSFIYETKMSYRTDPYAKVLDGIKPFGVRHAKVYSVICESRFDWKNDRLPKIPRDEMIMYKLHVRGYTKGLRDINDPGTFKALTRKIPYLKKLGVTTVELMPAFEFTEYGNTVNYWGYTGGFYFAPKASFSACYGKCTDYTVEFREFVRKMHKAGLEVIMEMSFPEKTSSVMIVDVFRFWKNEFHIDGIHFIGDDRIKYTLATDPYLTDFKMFATEWTGFFGENLFEYNDGFLDEARRLLKGDEERLQSFSNAFRKNPEHAGTVNYICTNNGFTLNDLVSYEKKHNEANGEGGKDGVVYNLSWNCGEEGKTRKKAIVERRMCQMRNAMSFLLLAQGIPLIYQGDEFGNSQNGNNNAYCQDNETGWVDWNPYRKNKGFLNFVQTLIAFRKEHKALHFASQACMTDYKYYGLPDMSLHGSKAWYPQFEHYNRHLGIMLCGKYAGDTQNIYIGINMHWEERELALPMISGRHWKCVLKTDAKNTYEDSASRIVNVRPRSMIVLVDEKNS